MASATPAKGIQSSSQQMDPVLILTAVLLSLAWLTVSLRVCVRTFIISAIGWDDGVLLLAVVLYTGMCAFLFMTYTAAAQYAAGHAGKEILASLTIYTIATMLFYIATTVAFKIALGLFYLRIVISRWQRVTVHVVLAISTVYGVAYLFITLFSCGNPSQYLAHTVGKKCLPWGVMLAVVIVGGIINTLSEWIFAILLLITLHRSQIPMPAKISAGGLLMLGTAGSICSVVRLLYIDELKPGSTDIHHGSTFTMWSIAECGICITAAALAATRPLFRRCLEGARTFQSTVNSRRGPTVSTIITQDHEGAVPLTDRTSQDWSSKTSAEWDRGRNYTTVVGNSRAMEKMGVTLSTVHETDNKWAPTNQWR